MAIAQVRAEKARTRNLGGILRTIAFTCLAGLFALAGFLMQEGLTEGLLPWKTVGCPGCPEGAAAYDIGVMRWYGAEHGATLAFLFSGSLIALLWRARAKPLLLQFYALGHLLLVLGYLVFPPDYTPPGALVAFTIMVAVAVGLLVLTYPAPRAAFSLAGEGPASRPLLAVTLAAALALAPATLHDLVWQVSGEGARHGVASRGAVGLVLALCLVAAGLLASMRRPGWRALGAIVGLTYLYLGAAALTVPDQPGSWGVLGGILALLGGAGYLAATIAEGRRGVPAPAGERAVA